MIRDGLKDRPTMDFHTLFLARLPAVGRSLGRH